MSIFHQNVNKIERALLDFYAQQARLGRGMVPVTARTLAEVAAAAVGDTRPSALDLPAFDPEEDELDWEDEENEEHPGMVRVQIEGTAIAQDGTVWQATSLSGWAQIPTRDR